jgi:LacI family transcriptional regulator
MSRPTIYELAEMVGLSAGTVSRVMNGREGIAPATRERVLRVAAEHGYQASFHARNLRSRRSLAIGVVSPLRASELVLNPVYPELLGGIGDGLSGGGYVLTLLTATDEVEHERVKTLVREHRVDGLIFPAARDGDLLVTWAQEQRVPMVLVGQRDDRPRVPWVDCDADRAAERLATRLLDAGRRRFAILSGPPSYSSARLRREGSLRALQAAGAEVCADAVGDFSTQFGLETARELLRRPAAERPDAILAASDLIAAGALQAAHDTSMRVPEDVAITGFDDRLLASYVWPALTTVRMPLSEMGAASAELVMRMARGEPVETSRLVFRTSLIARASTPEDDQ